VFAGLLLVILIFLFGPTIVENDVRSESSLRADILKHLAGSILQLTVLGVVGVAIKAAFDRQKERRRDALREAARSRREDQTLNEARKGLLRRVVAANRVVRKARILIPAHASAKTYGEQMRLLIDAEFELSDIRHEIETVHQTFAEGVGIKESLVAMERYLNTLTDEYQHSYQNVVIVEKTNDREAVRQCLAHLGACGDFVNAPTAGVYRNAYLSNYWALRDMMRRQIWGALLKPVSGILP
jgi:hypothetical protein